MENLSKKESQDKNKDLAKGSQQTEQDKPDGQRVKTVVPDNDSGKPGAPGAKPPGKK